MHEKILMSEVEVAQMLGMSRSFLRQARCIRKKVDAKNGPPFIRLGRSIRYDKNEVLAWLETKEQVCTQDYTRPTLKDIGI